MVRHQLSPEDWKQMEGITRVVTSNRSEMSPGTIKQTTKVKTTDHKRNLVMICSQVYVW